MSRLNVFLTGIAWTWSCIPTLGGDMNADPQSAATSFLNAKTLFQTNVPYDPRIAIAVDGVIVHQHGADIEPLRRSLASWKREGYIVGRMFFADSDAQNEYWTGKWDGTPHPDDVERDATGAVIKCAGVRPYMLPTDGWTRYLQEMTVESIDAGADAVLPEEPLAHAFSGYEKSFRQLWARRFDRPWEAESASAAARFLTGQLKNELYADLERRLLETTKQHARQVGRDVAFVLPVHSLYSNAAAQLVAPLGTSLSIEGIDGYIGQVWTGPVNWALGQYESPQASFFTSAYALYDYFVQLVTGSGKRLWLLADPVEDNPNHKWSEFEQWYRHSVVAKLLFPEVNAFEVMPWPDRIFLPGYASGGGTPAPQRYRVVILSAIQVLQEVPAGGCWCRSPTSGRRTEPTAGIGVAVADSVLWEKDPRAVLQGLYGALQPLLHAGVPVSTCITERAGQPDYLSRFRVIVLSYETWKPVDAAFHAALADWVRQGGSLIVVGAPHSLSDEAFWWKDSGYPSPLHHLLAELGVADQADGDHPVGRGWVLRRNVSPRGFAAPATARREYLPLVKRAMQKAGMATGLQTPGHFCMRRGPFVIASSTRTPLLIPGKLVDVFDPEFPVLDGVRLEPNQSGLYRDVSEILNPDSLTDSKPCVLHTTHRLMSTRFVDETLCVTIRGPTETPAVVRVFRAGRDVQSAKVRNSLGQEVALSLQPDKATVLARFPNDPDGSVLEIRWQQP
ncbi:MAG: hypothetical protein JSV19_08525 [Phycisphaerales bacterium]|nr:MAG: hypothetical protein JSV19_08525 [Phycisphaerales bacterium]